VGNYTAAAVSSIAFQCPAPAVDGNVLRVISRIFGIYDDISQQKTVSKITALCQQIMDKEYPGNFNQALMELGAIQCTPKNPKCETCPFAPQCIAFAKEHIALLPVKSLKTKIKDRYLHYFIFLKDFKTIIVQRISNDIWKNLYQFPLIETQTPCEKINKKELLLAGFGNCKPVFFKEVKHKLTHQHLTIRFYMINNFLPEIKKDWLTLPLVDLEKYPFPIPIHLQNLLYLPPQIKTN
jgi:A/G-specific adenine glycosylase